MDGDGGRAAGGGPLRVGACLSLSGRYARFGSQAVRALQAWAVLDRDAGLVLEDDRSDPGLLQALLPTVAAGCDVLLGPYSTQLARVAGKMAAGAGWLVWNHGGSGDDVQAACPGHAVSLLTPASRYAERFIRDVLKGAGLELWIVQGRGSFGRQVVDGAQDGQVVPEDWHRVTHSWPQRFEPLWLRGGRLEYRAAVTTLPNSNK